MGAMLAREDVAAAFGPGTHASTFGGNPVASAAAVATMKIMLADGFLAEVGAKGAYLASKLAEVASRHPYLASGVRGLGLIQALVLTEAAVPHGSAMINALFKEGLLLNFAGNVALRFIPPLVVSRAEIDEMIAILDRVLTARPWQ